MPENNIKAQFEQKNFNFLSYKYLDFISAAKMNGIDLPNNCCSGICTNCKSTIIDGSVQQEDSMRLKDDLIEKGFALLYFAYPKSDLHLVIGEQVEDDLYNDQFGKY